jgi:CelD/BcsL family acetyltransferase involved in cellulose biosynthesis
MNGEEPTATKLLDAFRSRGGFRGELMQTTEAPYFVLPASWDAYLQSLNAAKRRYLLKSWRDFESWCGGDWQLHRASAETLADGQAILQALHNHRWEEGAGIQGVFSRPRFTAFHQEFMTHLLRNDALDLFWLTADGEPIAVLYQIRANRKVYMYQCGRKLDVPPAVRPGIVLEILAVQDAIARGLSEYDFLGGLVQYKMQFAKTTRPLVELRIARPGPREWLRRGAEFVLNGARKLRRACRAGDAGPAPVNQS